MQNTMKIKDVHDVLVEDNMIRLDNEDVGLVIHCRDEQDMGDAFADILRSIMAGDITLAPDSNASRVINPVLNFAYDTFYKGIVTGTVNPYKVEEMANAYWGKVGREKLMSTVIEYNALARQVESGCSLTENGRIKDITIERAQDYVVRLIDDGSGQTIHCRNKAEVEDLFADIFCDIMRGGLKFESGTELADFVKSIVDFTMESSFKAIMDCHAAGTRDNELLLDMVDDYWRKVSNDVFLPAVIQCSSQKDSSQTHGSKNPPPERTAKDKQNVVKVTIRCRIS